MDLSKLKPYAKAVVAVAGFVTVVANAILASDATVGSVVVAALTALGVYGVSNKG